MVHLLLAIIYIAFISLGLPDGLLGAAWPTMFVEFQVPVSYAGIISMIISAGTIASSLLSDRLTLKMGPGKIMVVSVAMTATALLGFSGSNAYWMLCLWAIPYGLGAGGVDACLNNYVALHYASRHMSWLHCFWGVGASVGPYVMGYVLSGGQHWSMGYRVIGLMQIVLSFCLLLSLPLWKNRKKEQISSEEGVKVLSLSQILKIPGAKEIIITFFCYCALEQTTALWASSYLALHKGIPAETAAFFATLFFTGMTIGRALSGFLTIKFSDTQLIRVGIVIIAIGAAAMLLPLGDMVNLAGLVIIGFGCAPVYPCIIHSTPVHFGEERSQALIGVQMASAYVGSCLMPPIFGLIANHISVALFPMYILAFLILMTFMHEMMLKKGRQN